MGRRYTAMEKGKQEVHLAEPPRTGRVKVPDFDNSELVKQHSLTLSGRVTNPKIQRLWSLIPFFVERWKTKTPAVGADLGQGLFQFSFASREDMQLVLDERPYHFAHWMHILQQWEPTVDASFPSQIPFSIKVQGVPVHLWSEAMLRSIGEDLGTFESWEITKAHAKMRVHVNGLLPLLKTYTLEFPNGDVVTATLVYEKLEKHCNNCQMLDHEIEECPELPNPEEPASPPKPQVKKDMPREENRDLGRRSLNQRQREVHTRDSRREVPRSYGHPYSSQSTRRDKDPRKIRPYETQGYRARKIAHQANYPNYSPRQSYSQRMSGSRWVETGRRLDNTIHSGTWSRNREKEIEKSYGSSRDRRSGERFNAQTSNGQRTPVESSHSRRSNQNNPPRTPERELPEEALTEARGEVREVMAQYSNCADPVESAARKERLRLAEERGEVEQTAVQMVIHSIQTQSQQATEETLEPLMHERLPAVQRLSFANLTDIPITEEPERIPAKKRLGRPPNKKKAGLKPLASMGPRGKIRKVAQIRISPKRRLTVGSSSRKRTQSNSPASQGTRVQTAEGVQSGEPPRVNIIPAISRRRVDFQDPSLPLP
ncbi:unnamed protein product [Microthlaspi erraticum]|uniref:DUF4283 domain-containing protein n=1 Tax=Microthlaspi erraticum TaxID=1685480 RepID=A0A6D2JHV0_9BRAS|nr:unnamed protein product [Microthlaspi erraticum]